jgi:hypothetical protein
VCPRSRPAPPSQDSPFPGHRRPPAEDTGRPPHEPAHPVHFTRHRKGARAKPVRDGSVGRHRRSRINAGNAECR